MGIRTGLKVKVVYYPNVEFGAFGDCQICGKLMRTIAMFSEDDISIDHNGDAYLSVSRNAGSTHKTCHGWEDLAIDRDNETTLKGRKRIYPISKVIEFFMQTMSKQEAESHVESLTQKAKADRIMLAPKG